MPVVLDATPVLVVADDEHLAVLLVERRDRMDLELAESPRERKMLLGGDVLLAEEQHLVVEQPLPDVAMVSSLTSSRRSMPWTSRADRGTEWFEARACPLPSRPRLGAVGDGSS